VSENMFQKLLFHERSGMPGQSGRTSIWLVSLLPRLGAVFLLLLALVDHLPAAYFVGLRWYIFCLMVWWVTTQFHPAITRWREFWLSVYVVIGLLFNPILPARFSRDTWLILDLIAAVALYVSILYVPHRRHNLLAIGDYESARELARHRWIYIGIGLLLIVSFVLAVIPSP
jgi:hypothetical protein